MQKLRDQVVLLLISGMSPDAVEAYCVQRGELDATEARQLVAEARKRITVAADYSRDEQVGKAVMRLEDIYAKSLTGKDYKTALQTQRELNRLMSLYEGRVPAEGAEEPQDARRQVELIAGYLLPLKLADDRYPLEEHARIAADIIRRRGV